MDEDDDGTGTGTGAAALVAQQDALHAALLAATSLADPAAVAALTVKHVREVCGSEVAGLYWWDDSALVLLPLAVIDPKASGLHQVFHPGQGATGQSFVTGESMVTHDYPQGVTHPPAWKIAGKMRVVAAVPLSVGGRPAGVLNVGYRGAGDITPDHLEALRVVGDQVAPLLHSMRALAYAQFRLSEARELTALIRDTAVATDVAPVLGRICEVACRLLGADVAVVAQRAGPESRTRAAYGASSPDAWVPALLASMPEGDETVSVDLAAAPRATLAGIRQEQLETAVAVPLLPPDGAAMGALLLGWRFTLEPTSPLLALARTLAAAATSLLVREQADVALRASETLWKVTLDNAPVGICLMSLNGDFRLVNAAMTRILGYSEEELLGRNFLSITLPSHQHEKTELLRRLLAKDFPSATVQTQCIHADGHSVWTSVSAQFVPDESGQPAMFSVQLEDITAQHEQNEQLVHLATHDSLTGLANRRLFQELLSQRLTASLPTVVALIDVPDLHGLEDRNGHLPAAHVVRELAARLARAIAADDGPSAGDGPSTGDGPSAGDGPSTDDGPSADDGPSTDSDCVARLGSDEFAVMLSSADRRADEDAMIERLLAVFRQPVTVDGRTHSLSVHIGIAVSPHDGDTAQDLMHSADIALTEARREGRSARRHSAELRLRVVHRERLTVDLREALAAGTLQLAFQPIIDAATGRLSAAEALARWTHAEYGPIPPDVFVPLAEETGLMPALTSWAIDTALRACAAWQASKPRVAVAVNLSASDLQNPGIAQSIAASLDAYSLDPSLLELELTETTLMTDLGAAHAMLATLSDLGVALGIDDFGTGYSSLAYLQRLPMMTLKIDRLFVTTMLSNPGNAAIVTMVLQLAHSLGMGTVAEGVEDRETRERLTAMHCDRIQGYVIARPMPEPDFLVWSC